MGITEIFSIEIFTNKIQHSDFQAVGATQQNGS